MSSARFLVAGRVQGVCFRAWTRERALALGLAGTASNLGDGRVEVVVRGPDPALDALERDLWTGPPRARVDTVRREPCDPAANAADGGGFTIG